MAFARAPGGSDVMYSPERPSSESAPFRCSRQVHAILPFFYLHASDPVSPRSEVEPGNFHRWLGFRESRPGRLS